MIMGRIRRYLIAGLLLWVPFIVTFLVLRIMVRLFDTVYDLIPTAYQADQLLGVHIPGIGFFISLLVLFLTGIFATNFLGRRFVDGWDKLINRIPLVRTIYTSVKQVLNTLFQPGGKSFKKVLLVEYPRRDMWSIAFQTGEVTSLVSGAIGEDCVSIFIPTTPNPTSGFLMVVPTSQVIELNMSVDQALKMVISLGVVQPNLAHQ